MYQGPIQDFGQGGPSGVLIPGGPWTKHLLKIAWKLHDFEKILGAGGPLDPRSACVYLVWPFSRIDSPSVPQSLSPSPPGSGSLLPLAVEKTAKSGRRDQCAAQCAAREICCGRTQRLSTRVRRHISHVISIKNILTSVHRHNAPPEQLLLNAQSNFIRETQLWRPSLLFRPWNFLNCESMQELYCNNPLFQRGVQIKDFEVGP